MYHQRYIIVHNHTVGNMHNDTSICVTSHACILLLLILDLTVGNMHNDTSMCVTYKSHIYPPPH